MTMGMRVSFLKSAGGMVLAVSAPNGLMVCIAWGVSPSGNTNPLPGS